MGKIVKLRVFYFIITFSSLIKFPFQVMIYTMLQASFSCVFKRQIGFNLYDILGIVLQKVQSKTFNGRRAVWPRRDISLYDADQEYGTK